VPSPTSSPPEAAPARAPAGDSASNPSPSQALLAGDAFQSAALLLVDPAGLGGVRLRAPAGPVRDAWLALLQALAPTGMPLPRLPASASEDRLLGGLDLSATLAAGRPVAQAGLLHQADGGIVVAAMAERMPAVNATHLCAALDTAAVRLERDGLTQHLPARIAVVALDESQGEDRPLSAALADRLGLWVDLTPLSVRDTVVADSAMAREVALARSRLAEVTVPDDIVQALCAAALALGVDSARAAWAAMRCARAAAALRGAAVADAEDAALAARLVLAPRATRQPVVEEAPQEDTAPPAQPPDPPPEQEPPAPTDPPDPCDASDQPPPSEAEEPPAEPDRDPQNAQALEDRLIESAVAAIPAGLLARLASGERVRGRSPDAGRAGAAAASGLHGRPVGSRRGVPRGGQRLHLIDTLRAAAPWQRLRRAQARPDAPPILVRPDDFHLRRHEQKRSTTTIFALDASGSSALYRLAEAKGAIELLLAECYVRRDQVAVLAFRGAAAQVILPPTRSLVRAKRGLAGLPGGGGTPLAAGLDAAASLAAQVRRAGGTPVVVLLTDGRANVGRDGQGGRARAHEEALGAARALRAQGGSVIVIDTSVRPEPAALALALAAGARYVALPQADAAALSRAVQGAHGRG
jgi:magnesium chelatase subunit D